MGFLDRVLGRKQGQMAKEAEAPAHAVPAPECPHVALVPRWDSADDIGKADRVSSYVCEACQAVFSREEGSRLQATETERVRQIEAAHRPGP